MALITTLEQVQATGLRITNIDRGARLPDMDYAEQEYLLPHLGQDLIDALGEETLTNEYQILLGMVRKPLAAFAYWNDLPHIHSRITDAGVRRTTTDNTPTAYRWEYEEARSYLEERAYSTLEMLLAFLDQNQDDFPEWANDDAVQETRKQLLMKSGSEFTQRYRLHQPYRCYYYLAPIVHDVERLYLEPMIGPDFLQSFRDKAATTALTYEEKQAMMLMKLAIAHLTIYEASKRLPCTITPLGFMVRNVPGGDKNGTGSDGMSPAKIELLHRAADASYVHGKKTLANLRKFLNENASPTVLADYYTSEYYSAENTPILDRKNDARKIFRL